MNRLTDSRLANLAARRIHHALQIYQNQFMHITRLAKERFETRDWVAQRRDAINRLDLYKANINPLVAEICDLLADRLHEKLIWASMKAVYSSYIEDSQDCEIAETFFNSVTRRVFSTIGVDPQIEFVDTDFVVLPPPEAMLYRTYSAQNNLAEVVTRMLEDVNWTAGFEDLTLDSWRVAQHIEQHLLSKGLPRLPGRIEMLKSVFYRGMGAYLVGRMIAGGRVVPLVLAMLHGERGIYVDAVLLDENSVSILFSFARSYFHVVVERPYDLIQFLRTMMPRKRTAELYISIGYNKHGKTALYRDFLYYLAHSEDQFRISRGQKGMVMVVFDLPGYDMVFKVIRDHFGRPKRTTAEQVKEKYAWVFRQDRAGRLVDAQSFEHLEISRRRFSDDLLAELGKAAQQMVSIGEDKVVIHHCYIERKVTPLDIYLRETDEDTAVEAVYEYGQAIKDLAYSNVFTGDMLLKNFGVTRHGRVVFYDYDELCALDTCNFRQIPTAYHDDDELSDGPWFPVAENDIFPEEFARFVGLTPPLRKVFTAVHGDLFHTDFWHNAQENIAIANYLHVYPYRPDQRLRLPASNLREA
ncbi:MAG: bifunctional isocitrate dehydrogenase kinase/phosphatase [Anaerolineales bacterium]|nr:bifunctional isocitrate dehydrogenase kinase/phosphatase [Anaerolineales bacterium]